MKKQARKKIEFQLAAAPGSRVSVVGAFNGWDPSANVMKDTPASGHYKTAIAFPQGKHEYKFVVDGDWRTDPNCPESVSNCHGTANSLICVQA